MKRRLLLFSILVMTALALAFSPVLAQDQSLLIWADNERIPLLEPLGEQFEEEFGIAVEFEQRSLGDARDQLLVAGPVGEGPDIVLLPHDTIGLLVANDAIAPLDLTGFEEDFQPAALTAVTYEEQIWGLPYGVENIALFRNTDLVPEAPTTWQEVRAISEALQESGDAQYGILFQTGDTYHNFPVFSAFGGYIFGATDEGGLNPADIGLNNDGALAAAEWLSGMYTDGLMVPDVDNDVIFSLFEAGDLAMFVTGPWFSQRTVDTGQPYAISALPGAEGGMEVGAPFSGVQGFFISNFSENQLLAETFLLDFLATQESMEALLETESGIFTRLPAFVGVDISGDPNAAGFIEAGANAVPMPAIPEMGSVWAAAGNALTLISTGDDPIVSMNDAVAQIEEAIALTMSDGPVVGVPGSYQDEVGCPGEWDPACAETLMTDNGDGTFSLTVTIPAGDYEYKVALDGGWDVNYGVDGVAGGDNLTLSLSEETEVTFTYDSETNIISDSVNGG